jgi:hypothetical protein
MAQPACPRRARGNLVNAHTPDARPAADASPLLTSATLSIDRNGHLLHADDRLMREHLALGGEPEGELALPALLELAHHAQRLGMRLSRPVTFAVSSALVEAWCECTPTAAGTDLVLISWRESPLPAGPEIVPTQPPLPADPRSVQIRVDALGRVIRFDPPQDWHQPGAADRVILRRLSELLETAVDGDLPAASALDGQHVTLAGDARRWQVQVRTDPANATHVLVLTEVAPPSDGDTPPPPPPMFDGERLAHLFGSKIGPALRLPIGRIIANAETIGGRLEGPLRADYASYAGDIASAGRHLLALVDDLADLEAVDSSGFSAAREPVDLADLARRAAGLLALKAADRTIRIDKPADDDTLPAIGEFRRVLQILLNLLGNAITYAPNGSMIWLRLDDGLGWSSITVADQGPGLTDEDQQRLFNKWERLGRSGDGGSGLGLYISRRLAEAMDGTLTVQSAPGQGARFTLTLPRA